MNTWYMADIRFAELNMLRNCGGAIGARMVALYCTYIAGGVNGGGKQRSKTSVSAYRSDKCTAVPISFWL